ncbi:alpha/beta hydrolase [Paracrocinitomix mangrovi]|uniref:alpha/beta fold hydrolase n=1 Tax=Paracrocinitomix mangrovi TaxID=2862509 RepID=UPI001C8D322D|nr:alpha/beta hydrolase [Paracrocinitomix mangrovi]UKN01708.1 alpha/beta hydrolase [Paracrocinitomix mangrovi]
MEVQIHRKSYFKNPEQDHQTFRNWVQKLSELNGRSYDELSFETSLGKTTVFAVNKERSYLETVVIFPGFRTTSLIWDLDKGLDNIGQELRVFMVETNGQPNLSEGNTPNINGDGYGHWAAEVIDALNLDKPIVAGASFGGNVSMKLAVHHPDKVKAVILLNSGCFTFASMGVMGVSILPIINPSRKNINKFLNKGVFYPPNHQLSNEAHDLLVQYQELALKYYKDKTQKPRAMVKDLVKNKVPVYMLMGDKDRLFPVEKNLKVAKKVLGDSLKEVKVLKDVGHGIECHPPAMQYLGEVIEKVKG